MGSNGRFNNVILLGSNHYSSPVASGNTHSIDLESSSFQYLSITDASQTGLDITGDMTIETWVNFETLQDQWIVTKHGTSGNRGYAFWYNPSNKYRFSVSSNGSNNSVVSWAGVTAPSLGVWYHLVIIYDASAGSAELFINGISQGTKTGLNNSIYNNTASFKIGEADNSSFPFDGLIDDVRIWDDIRTPTEIANNFNKQLVGNEANLVAYWKLNNSPNDLTSNGNDLTENNSPTYSTDVPFLSDGANTHSIDLEASSSQYLSITDASQTGLDITGDLTLELWVKWETVPTGIKYLISKWDTVGNQRGYILYYNNTGGSNYKLIFGTSSNGSNNNFGILSWTPVVDTWYHIAVTYDASAGSCEMFINGVSIGTDSTLHTSINNNTAPLEIGGYKSTSTVDGKLDDIRIWSGIRTDAEILENFNKELVGNEAGLVAYWKLNNDATDSTSNGNDLTENNSPVYSTDTPF